MPLADHLRLRGRSLDRITAPGQKTGQQIPRLVGREFEQGFVHRRQCELATFSRAAVRFGDAYRDAGLLAGLVHLLCRLYRHFEFIPLATDLDLGNAKLVGRLAQIYQRCWLHITHPAAHDQDRDKNVRPVVGLDRQAYFWMFGR